MLAGDKSVVSRRRDMAMENTALVLFSGGQDSTTCLAWALDRFDAVETIGFDYGQRHAVELDCRPRILDQLRARFPVWGAKLGADCRIDISALNEISDTALTRDVEIEMDESGLPTTFVPGRNLLFLTYAGAVAYRRGAKHLVGGMCERRPPRRGASSAPECSSAW